ncbi:hypothetical protein [Adhaeribacter pallidiroseus]|uniref:Uncharacterized protein n=1 Tax=Adhaeribacter pallidiroseus TaxID=2072847 RepID=A0A369Q1Q4_9BACT|nr:hypothetical protein [Adhaeribacter pallidiroseus]RDC58823.1 hypothetical protein AHMF7616_05257 [Adhaeribacter pallidiroseus]
MEKLKTKQAIYEYLIAPSPLFLKQVVDIAETKTYILVMDSREMKKRAIPDTVIERFENRLQDLCQHSCNCQDYDGVNYLLIPKI